MRNTMQTTMPLNLVLCDDDDIFLDELHNKLAKLCKYPGIIPHIKKVSTGKELLKMNMSDVHVLFLDIKLAEENGVDVAAELHRKSPKYKLIFITELMAAEHRAFEIDTFRHLPKALLDTLLKPYLDDAVHELGMLRSTVRLKIVREDADDPWVNLFTDDIIYIELEGKKCVFHLFPRKPEPQIYRTKYTLADMERMLPEDEFLKINRHMLVRVDQINSMSNYHAYLLNGEALKVSEKLFSKIRRSYIEIKGGAETLDG